MKIVLATPLYPPEHGGPATYAQLLIEHWSQPRGKQEENDKIILVKFSDVRHLPKGIRHVAYFFRVIKAARYADVILALDPVSVGLPALWASRLTGKPLVVKIVGDFAWEQGKQRFGVTETLDEFILQEKVPSSVAFLQNIESKVARKAQAIIVPSNYLKGVVSSWKGVRVEKIHVIYNSMELPELPQSDESLKDKDMSIVSVGRLVPWKGMAELIDSMVQLQKEFPAATLSIVGDGPERTSLEEKAQRYSEKGELTPGTVHFTGALSHAEALAVVRDATIYVQNSSYEGLSHQLIEALMLGKAIIATNVGGNPELIEGDKNGILIAWGDSAALASELKRLLHDEELRKRLETAALESSTRFSVPPMIEKTRALLLTVGLARNTTHI